MSGSRGKSRDHRRCNSVICGHGGSNSPNNGSNSSKSVVGGDRADGRINNRGDIAVGVWESVVDKSWVSLSISLTLGKEVVSVVCVVGESSIWGVSTVGAVRVSPIGGVGMINTSTIGQVLRISIGFRLSHSSGSESENYKHLHPC